MRDEQYKYFFFISYIYHQYKPMGKFTTHGNYLSRFKKYPTMSEIKEHVLSSLIEEGDSPRDLTILSIAEFEEDKFYKLGQKE